MRNPEEPVMPSRARVRRHLLSEGIVANSLDGIACTDAKLRITVWNPAMERATGVSAANAAGKPLDKVLPFAAGGSIRNALERALHGEKSVVAGHFLHAGG
jgi:PAS domain S-box-containing protein